MCKFKYSIIVSFLGLFALGTLTYAQTDYHLAFLEDAYEKHRFCEVPLRELKNKNVVEMLQRLKAQFPEIFHYEEIGRSVEERPIFLVRLGTGPARILLWSQMHGDEPTATAALIDVFNYLVKNRDETFVKEILEKTTVLAVPMLNPDGAEKFQRRNAQGLDINRDARDLQSPEGKILFDLKETYRPDFGFNLHDQNARRTVGKTNKLAAFALMAPPYDAADNDNPVRLRAKQIVSVIHQALGPYLYGHISKYDAEYMPRSFGDSMQNWGVSTVLVESGGWYEDRDEFLQKMNFIALIASFHAIATGSYGRANPAVYDVLAENDKNIYDLLIRDVEVFDGTGIPPFRADIGINYDSKKIGTIADMGDLDIFAAKDTLDGTGFYLAPGFIGVLHEEPFSSEDFVKRLKDMFQKGYTTILISSVMNQLDHLEEAIQKLNFPANFGGLLYLKNNSKSSGDILQILNLLSEGMMGVLGQERDSVITRYSSKPVIPVSKVNLSSSLGKLSSEGIKYLTSDQASQWKIPKRGKIRRGQIADLILFSKNVPSIPIIHTVFLKGHPVWQKGKWVSNSIRGECWFPK